MKVSLIFVLQFVNSAQFLNATFVLLSAPATAIFPVTRIYASELSQRLDSNELVRHLIGFLCE